MLAMCELLQAPQISKNIFSCISEKFVSAVSTVSTH